MSEHIITNSCIVVNKDPDDNHAIIIIENI